MFGLFAAAALAASIVAPPAAGQDMAPRRGTRAIPTDAAKPTVRQPRVSRESLAIVACTARAAKQGQASFQDMRLVGRLTYLVTGTIVAPRGPRPRGSAAAWTFACTVRGGGEILAFKAKPAR
jgi:hypothetical protein